MAVITWAPTTSQDNQTGSSTDSLNVTGMWEDSEQPSSLLWLPYLIITSTIIILLAGSFIQFHHKNKDRYLRRNQFAYLIKVPDSALLESYAKKYSALAGICNPSVHSLPYPRPLFSLPPPGTSILPHTKMITIPEEGRVYVRDPPKKKQLHAISEEGDTKEGLSRIRHMQVASVDMPSTSAQPSAVSQLAPPVPRYEFAVEKMPTFRDRQCLMFQKRDSRTSMVEAEMAGGSFIKGVHGQFNRNTIIIINYHCIKCEIYLYYNPGGPTVYNLYSIMLIHRV